MRFIYLIWSLLPLTYLFIWIIQLIKQLQKSTLKEPPSYYFKIFLFCFFLFLVSITIEKSIYSPFISETVEELFGYDGFSWLIYPAVLLIGSIASSLLYPTTMDLKRKGNRAP